MRNCYGVLVLRLLLPVSTSPHNFPVYFPLLRDRIRPECACKIVFIRSYICLHFNILAILPSRREASVRARQKECSCSKPWADLDNSGEPFPDWFEGRRSTWTIKHSSVETCEGRTIINISRKPLPLLPIARNSLYDFDRRRGGAQTRSGLYGKKRVLPLSEVEPQFLAHPARSPSLCRLSTLWIYKLYFFEMSKSKSHYDRQSVGQSVLVSGALLGPATNFTFSLKFSAASFVFVIL
jgi:hypothetical protein